MNVSTRGIHSLCKLWIVILFQYAVKPCQPFHKGLGRSLNPRKISHVGSSPRISSPLIALENHGKHVTVTPQKTPHSGRHFRPSHPAYRPYWPRWMVGRKRFMEGWYFRLTLPEEKASFAIIISIEDAGNTKSPLRLACIQIVGPGDTYLVKADKDDTKFWALKNEQGLGCTFSYNSPTIEAQMKSNRTTVTSTEDWFQSVRSGFQIMPTSFLGKIEGYDGTASGALEGQGSPSSCEFDFTVEPICGWGDAKSTGGWLSHFSGQWFLPFERRFVNTDIRST